MMMMIVVAVIAAAVFFLYESIEIYVYIYIHGWIGLCLPQCELGERGIIYTVVKFAISFCEHLALFNTEATTYLVVLPSIIDNDVAKKYKMIAQQRNKQLATTTRSTSVEETSIIIHHHHHHYYVKVRYESTVRNGYC